MVTSTKTFTSGYSETPSIIFASGVTRKGNTKQQARRIRKSTLHTVTDLAELW